MHALYPDVPINNEISDEHEKIPDYPGLEDLQNLLKDELKKIMPTAINSANGIGKNKLIVECVLFTEVSDVCQENSNQIYMLIYLLVCLLGGVRGAIFYYRAPSIVLIWRGNL